MNVLPKTLSRDIHLAVKGKNVPDCFIDQPRMLYKFVMQATLDIEFCEKRFDLCRKSFMTLSRFVILGFFAADEHCKIASIFLKFRFWFSKSDSNYIWDCKFFLKDNFDYMASRLFLSANCTNLRQRWRDKIDEHEFDIKELTSSISHDNFFDLMYAEEYGRYKWVNIYEPKEFFPLLSVSKQLGNEKVFNHFQTICASKITQFETALEWLSHSQGKYPLIEKHCRTFLDRTELFVTSSNGQALFTALSFSSDSKKDDLQDPELIQWDKLFNDYMEDSTEVLKLRHLYVSMYIFSAMIPKWFLVTSQSFELSEFQKIKERYRNASRVPFKELSVESINFDLSVNPKSHVIAGVFAYLTKVMNLELSCPNNPISLIDCVMPISQVRNNLTALSICRFSCVLTSPLIHNIGRFLPHLNAFNFSYGSIAKDILSTALNLEEVRKMELSICKIELPDDLTVFSRLQSIELNLIQLSKIQLTALFRAAIRLKRISLINVRNFNIADYPYPENIEEIKTEFDSLYPHRESLPKFKNLFKLYFIDKIDPRVQELYPYLFFRNCGTIVQFLGGNK